MIAAYEKCATALAGTAVVLALAVRAIGCGADPVLVRDQSEIEAWTSDDGVCIKNGHGDKATIDACRDSMRRFFCSPDGGMLADSGACLNVTLSNGLRP